MVVKAITSYFQKDVPDIDRTHIPNQEAFVREVAQSYSSQGMPSTAASHDLYAKGENLPEHLFSLTEERQLATSILGRENIQKISYMEVNCEGEPVEVEIGDSNPVYLPSEIRSKEVIEDILPSVVTLSVDGVTIDEQTGNEKPASWTGSGFVVDPEDLGLQGYMPGEGEFLVATNHHVANGAQYVEVELSDGTVYDVEANILISNEDMDVAILVVNAGDDYLPNGVPIGDVNDISQGEFVLAFGSPYGLPFRVTRGIVNNRHFDEEGYIQTDAAINPGNSGGPLVDLSTGNVVGMNTFIYRGANTMGFAMPIWQQFEVLRELWQEENWTWHTVAQAPISEI